MTEKKLKYKLKKSMSSWLCIVIGLDSYRISNDDNLENIIKSVGEIILDVLSVNVIIILSSNVFPICCAAIMMVNLFLPAVVKVSPDFRAAGGVGWLQSVEGTASSEQGAALCRYELQLSCLMCLLRVAFN